jgi:hypothetical protein
MTPETILTVINAYKATKRVIYNGSDRPPFTTANLHLTILIAMGHFLFIIGLYFLLSAGAESIYIISLDALFVLALTATIVNDIQDLVFKKKPLFLYLVIVAEFILWATLTIIALMSARLGEGVLLFLAAVSRIADLFLYYVATIESKRE